MPRRARDFECQENPEVVRYHPNGTTFAVQCDDGSVTLHRDSTRKLKIPASEEDHVTADMIWGYGSSDKYLFASSSSTSHSDIASGRHKAFDAVRCKCVVEFDASNDAGNCLALDPLGLRLFAATETTDGTFFLRQFDAHRRARAPVQQLELEPFRHMPSRAEMNVNALAVSPDGLYIAVGRSDNWADVYDSRMLSRGMLYSFAHEGDPGGDAYGVVKAQWVDGPPFGAGLVTGGIEGCVRLWDLRRTSEDPLNGTILAQCDYDVGTFSLGDPYKDEVPLIVGEKSGLVTFWGQAPSQDEVEDPRPPIFLS
ncbi:WD40-repeat-containing domain protein [Trametes elegans]|nr:WD40-repeat-containing domain protein [Trametes elegans]